MGKGWVGGSTDPWSQGRQPGVAVEPQLMSPQWFKEGRVTGAHSCVNLVMLLVRSSSHSREERKWVRGSLTVRSGDPEVRRPKLVSLDQNQHAGRADFPEGLGEPASLPFPAEEPSSSHSLSSKPQVEHRAQRSHARPGPTPSAAY